MSARNGEARQCANTNRASNVRNPYEKTNMSIVATNEFTFQDFTFNPVRENGVVWLTSTDLAKVLGYKKTDAISQIYSRNSDEFTDSMTLTLNMRVNGINNSLRNKSVRVYSLRGAHLIAMFATTPVAKEFRRWILDILDREVSLGNVNPAFNFEMYTRNANVACTHMAIIRDAWINELHPALKAVRSPLAEQLYDRILDAKTLLEVVRSGLERVSGYKGLQH